MALIFREAHAAPDKKRINEEYFVLENGGATAVSTARLQVISAREGKRGSVLGVIDPGFMLQPGEKILVVTGVPGKKSHGDPPAREGMRTYHLFQHAGLLVGAGTIIKLAMNQVEVAKLVYDPKSEAGVAPKGDTAKADTAKADTAKADTAKADADADADAAKREPGRAETARAVAAGTEGRPGPVAAEVEAEST